MKNIFYFFFSLTLIIIGCTSNNRKVGAEWTTLRANNNRDGRIVSTGEFKHSVSLSESIDYSTSEAYIELLPDSKSSSVSYSAGKVNQPNLLVRLSEDWQTEAMAYLDLYGDGKITKVSVGENLKYAKLFRNDDNYYRIEAYDGYNRVVNSANRDTVFAGIRVYEGNTDKLKFQKSFPKGDDVIRPHITVADMDNDGEKDIIVNGWEGIYVFNNKGDALTCLKQDTNGWHHLRKRGFACIADIDGNGYKDVIIIGAYPYHVDVINNNAGVLTFGWTRIFDGRIESAKKISKPILNSVSDFDGDGTYEVLVNVYNYNEENNWSGILFDARNGKVKAQIKSAYVLSAEDLNNDGKYVFFCTETEDQSVPLSTALKVVRFKNGEIKELFRIDKGEWINPRISNTAPTVTTHRDRISCLAEDEVLCVDYESIGHKAFFIKTKNQEGGTLISAYYILEDGEVRKAALAIKIPPGTYGEILREKKNADGRHSLLLQVKAFGSLSTTVNVKGAHANDLGRYISPNTKTYIPVVADLNSDGSAEILIPNSVGEVLCFGRNSDGIMSLDWSVPGHGMLLQYSPSIDYGVSAEDVNHDGYKEVIISGASETGAAIFAYDHKGKLLWQRAFPEINAGDITTFDGNIAFFGTAQSSKRKNRDVIVTVQRVIQHTGKTYCLNGIDGSVIWELDTLNSNGVLSGAGGNIFSTYDIDGDGSDEVMCGYGNIVFFADSNDGTIKFKKFMRKVFTDRYDYSANGYATFWVSQILPVAFKSANDISLSCFNTSLAAGTMDAKGTLSWCPEDLEYTDRNWQCMANLDGDGKLWVVELSTRSLDNTRVLFAYDPRNGIAHKTFSMEVTEFMSSKKKSTTMPAACDMNGDGRDEVVIHNDTGVYCIGYKGNEMSVLWKYLAHGCGPPVIADADSDGFVEVVVATENGKVLVLDK